MRRITITAGDVKATATLKDTPTADALWQALPIKGRASTWGQEIYFSIPVHADLEPGAGEVVELGDIAYWPPGSAFCIFFGATPVSGPGEIRAASPVNVMGKIEGDAKAFKAVANGATVTIEKA